MEKTQQDRVAEALATYRRARARGYPHGDAMMTALTLNPHVSRTELQSAVRGTYGLRSAR